MDEEERELREKYCRVLHLHDVRKVEAAEVALVVIKNVRIDTNHAYVNIPYQTPGVDQVTDTLDNMHPSCFYLWDFKRTVPLL